MKKLLIILIISLFSYSAYADKIQFHFFCENKFSDGSGRKFTIKVDGKKMIIKDLRRSNETEYKEIYFANSYGKEFTIFVIHDNNSHSIIFLAPTENKNKIMTTGYSTENFDQKSMISHGSCDRI